MKKEKEDIFIIRENHKKITVTEDLYELHQELRKEYYILSSLKGIVGGCIFYVGSEEEDEEADRKGLKKREKKANDLVEKIDKLLKSYISLDTLMADKGSIEEIAITLVQENLFTESPYEHNYIIMNSIIKLSEMIQEAIQRSLYFVVEGLEPANEKMSEMLEENKSFYANVKLVDTLNYSFNRSVDEDRIINYELILSEVEKRDKELKKGFKIISERFGDKDGAIIIKKQDCSHNIEILKMKIIKEFEYMNKMSEISREVDSVEKMKKFNDSIFKLTFIAPIIALVSIFPILNEIKNKYGNQDLFVFFIFFLVIVGCLYGYLKKE